MAILTWLADGKAGVLTGAELELERAELRERERRAHALEVLAGVDLEAIELALERLRHLVEVGAAPGCDGPIFIRAADEIHKLRTRKEG